VLNIGEEKFGKLKMGGAGEIHIKYLVGTYLLIKYLLLIQVESYPLFQGLEKHYLRAQIARITATTQISPRDYFVLNYNSNSYKWRKLNSFQSKVMSQKCKFLKLYWYLHILLPSI